MSSRDDPDELAALREPFEQAGGFTIGLEEEVLLVDPETFAPAPVAAGLLARLAGDQRFKAELPAAQVEIATEPADGAAEAIAQLRAAREALARAAEGLALPMVAAVHPCAPPLGALSSGERYQRLHRELGTLAELQQVASLQIHVAVGGAQRTIAVHDALRCLLPELAALAANAPFYAGRDSGLASVRPSLCLALPREGIPPRLGSFERYADELRWGANAGALPVPMAWWWELRPHPRFGTLELRVPDAQTSVAQAAGVAALAQALIATLAERHDAGEPLPDAPAWRIAHNRFQAQRHGLGGCFADLDSGCVIGARERLAELIEQAGPAAARLGAAGLLAHATELVRRNGAQRQRDAVSELGGIEQLPAWLAARFTEG
jgi:carboxylate-amine ligase